MKATIIPIALLALFTAVTATTKTAYAEGYANNYANNYNENYICKNGITKQRLVGEFYRDEALLIQLAGGTCHKEHRPYREVVYECTNSINKKRISGEFDKHEVRLIQLGGGICKVKPQYLNNGIQGDVSALKKASISDKAIEKAIREARSKFQLHDHEFIGVEGVDEGFKSIKFSLVFRNWEYKTTRIRVKMRYWSEKIKSMHKE